MEKQRNSKTMSHINYRQNASENMISNTREDPNSISKQKTLNPKHIPNELHLSVKKKIELLPLQHTHSTIYLSMF